MPHRGSPVRSGGGRGGVLGDGELTAVGRNIKANDQGDGGNGAKGRWAGCWASGRGDLTKWGQLGSETAELKEAQLSLDLGLLDPGGDPGH